jgi:hypothetical protein
MPQFFDEVDGGSVLEHEIPAAAATNPPCARGRTPLHPGAEAPAMRADRDIIGSTQAAHRGKRVVHFGSEARYPAAHRVGSRVRREVAAVRLAQQFGNELRRLVFRADEDGHWGALRVEFDS